MTKDQKIIRMQWSVKQQQVLEKVENGDNIMLTGPGGSGKSTLIRHIYKTLTERGRVVQVCAMTGCAALLLKCKAKTVHSFAGIGLGKGTISDNIRKVLKNPFKLKCWQSLDMLIIDEVSMMSMKMFDMLDQIGRRVRGNKDRPFGGIQIIFSGDFYQLSPVENKDDPDTGRFCFESETFMKCWDAVITLDTSFRQHEDPLYSKILGNIRRGVIIPNDISTLEKRVLVDIPEDKTPTKLYSRRNQVEMMNQTELSRLQSEPVWFEAEVATDLPMTEKEKRVRESISDAAIKAEVEYIISNIPCERRFSIKEGAQVMCVVNLETSNLCNGSQGVVIGFTQDDGCRLPIVRFFNGTVATMNPYVWESENIPGIGVRHIPLILSWALTIHKAQGATIEMAEIDAGASVFDFGQTYVALSRVKSLDGLYLRSFDPTKIHANPIVVRFYETIV